jgi:hypothetical protein
MDPAGLLFIMTFVCSAEEDLETERKLTHPAHMSQLCLSSSQNGCTWIATVTSTNPKTMLVQIYRTGQKPVDTRVTNTFTDYLQRSKWLPSTMRHSLSLLSLKTLVNEKKDEIIARLFFFFQARHPRSVFSN